jgi:hypothetical protein
MQIKVQITVKSEQGEPEVIQEVARLKRGPLQPDTLGYAGRPEKTGGYAACRSGVACRPGYRCANVKRHSPFKTWQRI